MKKNIITFEHLIFGIILFIAAVIRLVQLGANPLSDTESRLAMEALNLTKDSIHITSEGPFYSLSTGLLFFLFGSNNTLSRLIPSIFGFLLVFPPFLVREKIGKVFALILSLVFAIDPAFIFLSRNINSEIISITALVFLICSIYKKSPAWTGLSACILLMSGKSLWIGFIPIIIIAIIIFLFQIKLPVFLGEETSEYQFIFRDNSFYNRALLWFGIITILGGTLLFITPSGIGGIAGTFTGFLGVLNTPSNVSISQILITYIVYEPIPLLLGILSLVRGMLRKDIVKSILGVWWLLSLGFILILPGREATYIAWSLIPLWTLGIMEGIELFTIQPRLEKGLLVGMSFLASILIGFIVLNLLGFLNPTPGNVDDQLRLAGIGSGVILFLLLGILFGWAWSKELAYKCLSSGLLFFMLIYTISASIRAGGLGQHPEAEIWNSSGYFQEADLLDKTLNDVSEWNKGNKNLVDMTILGVSTPSLEWLLRGVRDLNKMGSISFDAKPSIIITNETANLSLTNPYRGQDFILRQKPNWSLLLLPEWAAWLVYHKAPVESEYIILWVRSDLFPGSPKTEKP